MSIATERSERWTLAGSLGKWRDDIATGKTRRWEALGLACLYLYFAVCGVLFVGVLGWLLLWESRPVGTVAGFAVLAVVYGLWRIIWSIERQNDE